MTLFLRNAQFIDWQSLAIRTGDIRVEPGDGGIEFVDGIPHGAKVVDCGGKWVTRSFAIAHHHIYSMLARGMPMPVTPPQSFVEILESIWWKLDKQLDADMIRASALACAVEAAKCGTTFLIDHHASPNAAEQSLHILAEALDEVGLSHCLCYELSDRDGPERLERGLLETEEYLRSRQGLVGLHASFTVSDPLLAKAVELAGAHDTGIHVHVAEAISDQEHCVGHHGKRVVARLHDEGALLPKTLLAHCLHLDDRERELLSASPSWVVQNTESNQNNGVGTFDSRGLGDRILIGTDGMHSDALASARAAYLAGPELSPLGAYRRLRRVHDYLAACGMPGDGDNNLVILDYDTPTPVHSDNWPAHLMYGLNRSHVEGVISSGVLIVDRGRVTTVDQDAVLATAREQAERLWRRL